MDVRRLLAVLLFAGLLLPVGVSAVPVGICNNGHPCPTPTPPVAMGRIFTSGYEMQSINAEGMTSGGSGSATYTSTNPRTGGWQRRFNAVSASVSDLYSFTGALGTTYFVRAYVRFTSIGFTLSGRVDLVRLRAGAAHVDISINTDTAGFILWNNVAGAQVGSGYGQLVADQWYRLDLSLKTQSGAGDDAVEMRVDGVSIASSVTQTVATTAPTAFEVGMANTVTGVNFFLEVDDIAMNDSGGASQNSFPSDGKVALLLPISDNAKGTGWQKPGGSTTDLFTSVDNVPPVGVADSTNAAQAENQIRNATSAANSSYDTNMTSYTTAGIGAADTINVVVPIVWTGAPVSTSAKQGTVGIASNPTVANVALGAGGTPGAFWSGLAANTFSTGWKLSWGTPAYNPSVTLGTSPVMRITQVTSSTRIADVCFMGMYVDYTPAVVAARVPYSSPYPQLLAH